MTPRNNDPLANYTPDWRERMGTDEAPEAPDREAAVPEGEPQPEQAEPADPELSDEEVERIRQALERVPRSHWEDILRREGASAAQIRQIMAQDERAEEEGATPPTEEDRAE